MNVSENPVTSVVLGLAKIIKDDNYKSVAYAIEGMSKLVQSSKEKESGLPCRVNISFLF